MNECRGSPLELFGGQETLESAGGLAYSRTLSRAFKPLVSAMPSSNAASLSHEQPGFLGVESARGAGSFGITISYWQNTQAIADWKANAEHRIAQETGKTRWYADYQLRVARVKRAYGKTLLEGS
jgi:heme-degrading monooxygenase HmoA